MFDFSLQVIAAFLNVNPTIRCLNLETCLIKDAGVEARCVLHPCYREYQKGMGKPGEAQRNGPGRVLLPLFVVTLTPLVPHVSWHGEVQIHDKSMSDHI